jgi:hypothetical protein
MMPDPKAVHSGGAVRISIPVSVAADLASFKKSIGALAERLGCPKCVSGFDCTFRLERDFLIDEKLRISPTVRIDPVAGGDPIPARGEYFAVTPIPIPREGVTATLAEAVSFDLPKVQEALARVAGRLGCPTCCSGLDLTFRRERDFLVDERVNVRGAGEGR